MIKLYSKTQLILASSLLLFGCISLLASPYLQSSTQAASDFSLLTLEMSSTKDVFVRLEPVPVIVTLTNTTDKPVLGHRALKFSQGQVELRITTVDGVEKPVNNLSPIRKEIHINPNAIAPGESITAKELITLNLDELFPQAGRYKLRAILKSADRKEKVESKPITINVFEPVGADAEAFDFIKRRRKSATFFTGVGLVRDVRAQADLKEFVAKFGSTAYGDYATFLLGETLFVQGNDAEAVKQLDKISGKSDFILSDKAKNYLEKIKDKSKTPEEQN